MGIMQFYVADHLYHPMTEKTLGIVIPVHNEQEMLPALAERLRRLSVELPELTEIIFVDDGSRDASFALLRELVDQQTGWRLISFSRNFGQQAAMLAGIQHSTTDAVVVMDADLQDPPEVIPEMIALWRQGWDVVYGVRRSRDGENWLKKLTARVFYRLLARMSEIEIPVDAGDFRLMDRKVVLVLSQLGEQQCYLRGLSAWAGFRQTGLEFDRAPRADGATNYNFSRMISLSIDAFVGFSSAPLRIITRLGIFTVIASTFYCLVVLVLWIAGINVPGWTSMMLVILFLGSVQLISLGVIGEYVATLTIEAKGRPRFIVAYDSDKVILN
jgi:dolichol-phosphate mannosyltransferase